jgi:hypothetical protein
MPATRFKCEAGIVPIKECFQSCPKGDRCLSIATLHKIGYMKERIGGKFSTTLLLKPTLQAYLEITCDYAITPKDRAFMLAGTEHHARIQAVADKIKEVKAELPIHDYEITSTLDNLEPDETQPDKFKLIDYKFIGAYAVVNLLEGDYSGYDWQINHYRVQAERFGLPVSRMFIQYTARDLTGKTAALFKDKFTDKIALIPVPRYDDNEVLEYFDIRRERLEMALCKNETPPICDDRWGDNRCKNYCDVAEHCFHGKLYKEAQRLKEEY